MTKAEARKRIEELKDEFVALFPPDVLDETTVRNAWLDAAARLAADAFGVQDDLYKRVIEAQELSRAFDL